MNRLALIALLAALGLLLTCSTGCEERSSGDGAAETVEEAADDAAETADDVADEAADAAEDLADDAQDVLGDDGP